MLGTFAPYTDRGLVWVASTSCVVGQRASHHRRWSGGAECMFARHPVSVELAGESVG